MNFSVTRRLFEERRQRREGTLREQDYLEPELRLPKGVSSANIRRIIQQTVPREGDVFICTFPKSGTTWMQSIIKLIRNNGVDDGRDVDIVSPWIDVMTPKEVEGLQTSRVFKTHLPYHLMPGGAPSLHPHSKYINVYRNPRDVAVSLFHHLNAMRETPNEWDYFIEKFLEGDVIYGSYFKYVSGWLEHRDFPNILTLCFEDMKRDLKSAVIKVATFLNHNLNNETVSSIVQQTKFENMKLNPSMNYHWLDDYWKRKSCFMRRGTIGDWKHFFTATQLDKIDKLVEKTFSNCKVKFEYNVD